MLRTTFALLLPAIPFIHLQGALLASPFLGGLWITLPCSISFNSMLVVVVVMVMLGF
jgi:hypothetical protein